MFFFFYIYAEQTPRWIQTRTQIKHSSFKIRPMMFFPPKVFQLSFCSRKQQAVCTERKKNKWKKLPFALWTRTIIIKSPSSFFVLVFYFQTQRYTPTVHANPHTYTHRHTHTNTKKHTHKYPQTHKHKPSDRSRVSSLEEMGDDSRLGKSDGRNLRPKFFLDFSTLINTQRCLNS